MRLLLINSNPVVSRMMQMGVPKAGFELQECESVYELPKGSYEVVIIDDEMYDQNLLQTIQQEIDYRKIGLITASKEVPQEIDFVLHKPFLPTDLLELLRGLKSEIEEAPQEDSQQESAQESSEEEPERIVEVEEVQEESPFVEEPMEKAGVLKEEEVAEVANLLQEEESELQEEPQEEIQEEPQEEPEPLVEVEQSQEPQPEPLEEVVQETPEPLEEPEVSAQDLLTEPMPQEESEEESQESVVDADEEEEVAVAQEQNEVQHEPHATESAPVTPEPQKELERLGSEVRSLGVQGIKEILNGMRLEITIKISYPDRDDVS